jgi:hypothetical protein
VSDDLRELVASEHGLSPEAASLLTGSTLAELEQSAAELSKLIGERDEGPAASRARDPFTAAAEIKAERKQTLMAALTGRAGEQPRDERGRFASTGFDGGARRQAIQPRQQSHDEWLGEVLRYGRADLGARF